MANVEHLARLQQKVELWNCWRQENRQVKPELIRANLRAANLRDTNLRDANLRDANLKGANLKGADLRGADLRGADFRQVILDKATRLPSKWLLIWRIVNKGAEGLDLRDANLRGANLSYADLQDTNLSRASFEGAILWRTNLSGANLSEAIMTDVHLLNKANLSRAILVRAQLKDADLSGANLSEVNLENASLQGANLRGANLTGANLTGVDLEGANLNGADLRGANLTEANLIKVSLAGAILDHDTCLDSKWRLVWKIVNQGGIGLNLRGADLTYANLNGVNLISVNLSEANLSGASLIEAHLSGATLVRANLSHSSLQKANLIGANLAGAYLNYANLTQADLWKADLTESKFWNTNLTQANLWKADLSYANLTSANLTAANLVQTQVIGTTFENAVLTAICIQDWNINSQTNLSHVRCDYIYQKTNQQERRPHDLYINFAPGDFIRLVQNPGETVDLIFRGGINWQAFLNSYEKLKLEAEEDFLSIQAIENKKDDSFVIRVRVPSDLDKGTVQRIWQKRYEQELETLTANYRSELQARDREIQVYQQESANLLELAKLAASKPLNTIAMSNTSEDSAELLDDLFQMHQTPEQPLNLYNLALEQKQFLIESLQKVQKVLQQLESANLNQTSSEPIRFTPNSTKCLESSQALRFKITTVHKSKFTDEFIQKINHSFPDFRIRKFEELTLNNLLINHLSSIDIDKGKPETNVWEEKPNRSKKMTRLPQLKPMQN